MRLYTVPIEKVRSRCYLLADSSHPDCAVIDPGGESDKITDVLNAHRLLPRCILLTHGHYDHTGGVKGLTAHWSDLPVYVHPRELSSADRLYHFCPPAGCMVRTIREGDQIQVGDLRVTAWEIPGHTTGGMVFQVEDLLFTGDTLMRGTAGRTDLPGGSFRQLTASLRRLKNLDGDYRIYPGHGEPTRLSAERTANPLLSALTLDLPE